MRRWAVRHAKFLTMLYAVVERLFVRLTPVWHRIGLKRLDRVLVFFERPTKRLLFDCKMCGDCILSSTGMSCPMICPKNVRNGPCGGVRDDGCCEVDPEMPCVWVDSWEGIKKSSTVKRYLMPRKQADFDRLGSSAWVRELERRTPNIEIQPVQSPAYDEVPAERQSPYPPNSFEALLTGGGFAVTAELSPPDSSDPDDIARRACFFEGLADAVNVPDGSGANCHMSSLASSVIMKNLGFTPVMQFACRDRNRIALQGDILGATALGIKNLLCLTGDGVNAGDQPGAKPVFDLDAVTLLRTATHMRDRGEFMSGRKISMPPDLFLGAALNPFNPPIEARPYRWAKKIAAGAQFVQTQYCFDVDRLREFMDESRGLGLQNRCHILVGVGPLLSARSAVWMRDNVPGIHVPDALIKRLQDARSESEEGKRICIEILQEIVDIEGISGVHVMVHKHEELLAEIIRDSGIRELAARSRDSGGT
jgi:methylenetetrahydrofolate reductase (NADPH)